MRIFKHLEQLVRRQPRPLPSPEEISVLDPQAAREVVLTQQGTLFFWNLASLGEEEADILARYDDDLWLGELSEISPAVATSLARHRHCLCLDGLHDISPPVAREIARHGRAKFDASLRRLRANHERWLKAMQSLHACKGPPRRSALRDALQFGMMEQHDWSILGLAGLRTLRIEVARELARHRGVLVLSGIESIDDECAIELGRHVGLLVLNGLRSLSTAGAATLARSSRWKPEWVIACSGLCLDGLKELSASVARELATCDGTLSFDGLDDLTPTTAAALAAHRPTNVVKRTLSLNGLSQLSAAAAEQLVDHTGDLLLNGITEISPELAEPLSRHLGRVFLGGVRTLPGASAQILLSSPQVHLVAGPECL